MPAYMIVLEYLLDHGSITVKDAHKHLGMESYNFNQAIASLKTVLQIRSERVPFDAHRVMKKHSLVRELHSSPT